MVDLTKKDGLNSANPNKVADLLRDVNFGDVLFSMVAPQERPRTGLASSATQVHDVAALIVGVSVANADRPIVNPGATPGATEVSVTYDTATGVPTLVFGAAVTQYEVMESGSGLATELALALA